MCENNLVTWGETARLSGDSHHAIIHANTTPTTRLSSGEHTFCYWDIGGKKHELLKGFELSATDVNYGEVVELKNAYGLKQGYAIIFGEKQ